jgi:hypothetical protein
MRVALNALETPPPHGGSALSHDERWQLAQRVAVSDIFSKSEFLPRFLLHICELHLSDRDDEIREQNIGVRVFGRPPSYNPGDDNIVRNYAVQLRKRLNLYFEGEGKSEEFRIEIPRGGYVPVFRCAAEKPESQPVPIPVAKDALVPEPVSAGLSHDGWRMFFFGVAAGVLLLGGVALWRARRVSSTPLPVSRPIWAAIFSKDRDTLIVPADSGLGILQNLTEQPADLSGYSSGQYLSALKVKGLDPGSINDLRTQRYTSMVDLNVTSRLSRLPEIVADHLIVRYARDLRIDDLRNDNAILLGAIHTDPWIDLLQTSLNFQFACARRVDDCYILNLHPAGRESSVYRSDVGSPYPETYSVIAMLPNLNHTGWILLIEGLNMAGTEAAANLLFDDATTGPVIRKAFSQSGAPRGFELLIKTGSLEAQALPARIVAERFGR